MMSNTFTARALRIPRRLKGRLGIVVSLLFLALLAFTAAGILLDVQLLTWGKAASVFLTTALGLICALADLRTNDDHRHLTFWGKTVAALIVVAFIFGIAVEFGAADDDRRATAAAIEMATDTNRAAKQASDKAAEAARTAAIAADAAKTAAERATVASENSLNSSTVLANVVSEVEAVKADVGRVVSQPIEKVGVDMCFALPMQNPALAEYKARVDKGFSEFLSLGPDEWDKHKNIGLFMAYGRSAGILWLTSPHSLYPSLPQRLARDALTIRELELALYRVPIAPKEFVISRLSVISTGLLPPRREPDLGIAEAYPRWSAWIFTGSFARERQHYRLERRGWKATEATWRKSGQIRFVDDLAGSQLFINIGGCGGTECAAVRQDFNLQILTIQINNAFVALDTKKLKKHLTKEGQPFWEYRFPSDPNAMFTSSAQPAPIGGPWKECMSEDRKAPAP